MIRIAFDPRFAHDLPPGHRFPMAKYEWIPEQLLHEGTARPEQFFNPDPIATADVYLTHTPAYVAALLDQTLSPSEQRKIGFPQSPALTEREWQITGGTYQAALYALAAGAAGNVAGGTHHAFADRGEGFCLLNDFAVSANLLLQQGKCQRIVIIDLDVHQGNGTASIMQNEERVFTFSMHGATNYPFHKEQSDLDIGLPNGCSGPEYLRLLRENLDHVLDQFKPDFAFYLSGVDVLQTDKFGKLDLSLADCAERDRHVFATLHQRGLPVCFAMGGGYSPEVRTIVEAHCQTFRMAEKFYG